MATPTTATEVAVMQKHFEKEMQCKVEAMEKAVICGINGAHSHSLRDYVDPSMDSYFTLAKMIAMRLRLREGSFAPFEALHAYKIKDGKVCVFLVHKGTPVLLEDGEDLFPSDALISQLRLLVG